MQKSSKILWDLYLVTDRVLSLNRPIYEIVKRAIEGGTTVIQLREKELSTHEFINEALEIKGFLKGRNVPLIINDRVDVALAVDADGVHLGKDDMPIEYAKRILPEDKIIGLSVESVQDAIIADKKGADYLGVSPIYTTPTKPELETGLGLEGLRQIREVTELPLVAIGGLKAFNTADVIKNGADGIAVVSAICSAPDPKKAAEELISVIKNAKKT